MVDDYEWMNWMMIAKIGRDRDIANFQKISNNSRKVSHDW